MLLYGIDAMSLWDQDEAAYAGFASNMLSTGNFAIPEFGWSEIHRKPPLLFWLTSLMFMVFGEAEWTTRFITFLSVLSLPGILFFGLRGIAGYAIARNTAIITGSTLLLSLYGKIAFTDGLLLLFSTICMIMLMRLSYRYKPGDVVLFWLAFGLALLTKGPAIVVVVFTALICLFFTKHGRLILSRLKPWVGLPLSVLPFIAWIFATWQADGGAFSKVMLDWYVLQRIGMGESTAVLDTWSGPPGYYFVIHLIAFLPWIWLFAAGTGYVRKLFIVDSTFFIVIAAWLFGSWIVWEFLPSKLPSYTLAAHPLLAFILASGFAGIRSVQTHERVLSAFGLMMVFLGALGLIMGLVSFAGPAIFVIAVFTATLFWVPMLMSTIAFNMNNHEIAFRICAVGTVVFLFLLWARIIPAIEPLRGVYNNLHSDIPTILQQEDFGLILYKLDNSTKMPSFKVYAKWSGTEHIWHDYYAFDSLDKVIHPVLTYGVLLMEQDTLNRNIIKSWPGWISDRNLPVRFYLLSPEYY